MGQPDGDGSALTDLGVSLSAWTALIRRSRLGRERKNVALTVASYADNDGTGIHCGVATLAVDCEMGYSTARRYLQWMRSVGLLEMVRRGNRRRGLSDEYRLIIGPSLSEHLDVPDPDVYRALKDEIRESNRAGQKKRYTRQRDAAADQRSAVDVVLRSPRAGAEPGAEPVDNPDGDGAPPSASALTHGKSAELTVQRSPGEPFSAHPWVSGHLPSITSPKEHTSPTTEEKLRTDLEVPRERPPEDRVFPDSIGPASPADQRSLDSRDEPPPSRNPADALTADEDAEWRIAGRTLPVCNHGLANVLRADGLHACVPCRRLLRAAGPPPSALASLRLVGSAAARVPRGPGDTDPDLPPIRTAEGA